MEQNKEEEMEDKKEREELKKKLNASLEMFVKIQKSGF